MTVHRSSERPFADVRHLGVVVCAVGALDPSEDFGLHSGFLYQLDSGGPRISHLGWHFELHDHPADDDRYLWADTGLDEGNSHVIAAWLSDRRTHPNDIPYGFDAKGSCFDKVTLDFVPPALGKGLTCATYIKAVFSHLGFDDFLDEGTWPLDRQSDRSWQLAVVEELRKRASQEHIAALMEDVGATRFRPAEVVGAATVVSDSWPVTFDDVAAIAQSIIVDVEASRAAYRAASGPASAAPADDEGDA
ncbi:hypothetical protein QCM77_18860 [Bradyrhizobium sp. SSUT18]|uniref:hypothetical protein n=1 Tax=Bradyrhizobium sp. SSUT18 TaxID=3040602 RepID=UPI00244AD8E1|nr:hypothetical protein [Bradyrhizobium sp. SSUT18]MDH2402003.1 hypothetical protein [Bradyrhizobium sp. SSUT18]